MRAALEAGFDSTAKKVWTQLAETLGVAGVLIPERFGGLGLGYHEAAILLEECGKALLAGPALASAVLAPAVLLATGDEAACARLLPGLAAARIVAAIARSDQGAKPTRAKRSPGAWALTGVKIASAEADVLLVAAIDEGGVEGLFEVRRGAPGSAPEALDGLDLTWPLVRVAWDLAPAARIGGAESALAMLGDVGAFAAAAEQLGICQRALDIAVAHAKLREQFGRPIGSFQAIKHICADMLTQTECLRAAVNAAAEALNGSDERARTECASIAKAFGSEAATFCTQATIQVLGGLGFTWEHPAHLYLRRAKSLQFAFGDAAHHRARLAALHGLGALTC